MQSQKTCQAPPSHQDAGAGGASRVMSSIPATATGVMKATSSPGRNLSCLFVALTIRRGGEGGGVGGGGGGGGFGFQATNQPISRVTSVSFQILQVGTTLKPSSFGAKSAVPRSDHGRRRSRGSTRGLIAANKCEVTACFRI